MSQYSSIFFLFFFFSTVNGDTTASYIAQCPFFTCGTLNISYPFWLSDPNRNSYCGYPGFGLSCTNQRPILHLPSDSYYVTQINYTQKTLTLVDIDLAYQSCPRAKHNVSFSLNSNTANPPPSLNYNSIDLNLTFFFNCSIIPYLVEPIPCMNSGGNRSFVFGGVLGEIPRFDWHGRCEESVVVPVLKTEANGLTLGGFGGALGNGFQVDWFLASKCGVCEASQGYCGYSRIDRSFVCYCKDGGYAEDCNHGLIDRASNSREGFDILVSGHTELEMRLSQATLNSQEDTSIAKGKGLVESNVVEYHEPSHVVTKGRAKRFKSSKEKATKGRLCRGCNKRGVSHDKRNCPALLNRLGDAEPSQSLNSNCGSRGSYDEDML